MRQCNHDLANFGPVNLPPRPVPSRKSPAPWQPLAIAGFLLDLFVGLGAVMVWMFNK